MLSPGSPGFASRTVTGRSCSTARRSSSPRRDRRADRAERLREDDPREARGRTARAAGRRVEGDGRAAFLLQDPGRYLVRETALDEVALGAGMDRAKRVLEEVGLAWAEDRHPRDLSSGERERPALATVFVTEPDLLVLDEPTRGVDDPQRKAELAELLRAQAARRHALVVTHDVAFAAVGCRPRGLARHGPGRRSLRNRIAYIAFCVALAAAASVAFATQASALALLLAAAALHRRRIRVARRRTMRRRRR